MSRSRLKKILSVLTVLVIAVTAWLQRSHLSELSSSQTVEPPSVSDISERTDAMQSEADDTEVDASPSGVEGGVMDDAPSLNATITHVVDGDTFDAELDGVGKVRIRMLGVNTPETVDPRKTVECFGKDASNFSKKTLGLGSRVWLEPDPMADERDKYGRLLRNVVLKDGTDYNALLIREGYAYAYLGFPLDPKRKVELKALEKEAKAAKRGLWGSECR